MPQIELESEKTDDVVPLHSFENILLQVKEILTLFNENPEVNTKGHLLYKCKFHLLSEYITGILFGILLKTTPGVTDTFFDQISEFLSKKRTILDKSKSIEARMRNQIQRILSSSTATLLSLKPNLHSILETQEKEGEEEEELYVAPKIAPSFYHSTKAELDKKKDELIKVTTKNKRLVQELQEEFSNRPEEIHSSVYRYEDYVTENAAATITQFEEDNFTRIDARKKKKVLQPKLEDALDELDSLGILSNYKPSSEEVSHIITRPKKFKKRPLFKKHMDEEISSGSE